MGQDHKQPNVVIYSDHLLPFSQTFVLQQGEALQHYQPHYLGSRQVQGLTIPSGRSFVVNPGSWWGKGMEFAHKTMSFSPTLRRQLKVLTPALLHAHFGPGGAILLPHAEALQLPLVVTFHGFDITVKDSVAQSSFYGHRIYLKRRHRL
ncbi:MAG: glycosyltransferase, partial [Caldilineaceae bacterium]|nr:glycosyltransferase [Caldilineaceae bacterium]